jgi:hypothetical protein
VKVHYLRKGSEANWSPLFAQGFTRLVEAEIMRGFNEDFSGAKEREEDGLAILEKSKQRNDQQQQQFRPRISADGVTQPKLGILNDALLATGRNPNGPGQTDWLIAQRALDRVFAWVSTAHRWNFANDTSMALTSTASKSRNFSFGYTLPAGSLKILATYSLEGRLDDYEIVGNVLCCAIDGQIRVNYLKAAPDTLWSPGFIEGLTRLTEAEILRSGSDGEGGADKEGNTLANIRRKEGEEMLALSAKVRDEQQPRTVPRQSSHGMTDTAVRLVNQAMIAVGCNPLDETGEDYWIRGREGFNRGLAWMTEKHPWLFATRTSGVLTGAGNDNPRQSFAYELPTAALKILSAYDGADENLQITNYELWDGELTTDVDSEEIVVRFIAPADDEKLSALFEEALTIYIEACILRPMENMAQLAKDREQTSRRMLIEAQTSQSQQNPPRDIYHGYIRRSRRYGSIGRVP